MESKFYFSERTLVLHVVGKSVQLWAIQELTHAKSMGGGGDDLRDTYSISQTWKILKTVRLLVIYDLAH